MIITAGTSSGFDLVPKQAHLQIVKGAIIDHALNISSLHQLSLQETVTILKEITEDILK